MLWKIFCLKKQMNLDQTDEPKVVSCAAETKVVLFSLKTMSVLNISQCWIQLVFYKPWHFFWFHINFNFTYIQFVGYINVQTASAASCWTYGAAWSTLSQYRNVSVKTIILHSLELTIYFYLFITLNLHMHTKANNNNTKHRTKYVWEEAGWRKKHLVMSLLTALHK